MQIKLFIVVMNWYNPGCLPPADCSTPCKFTVTLNSACVLVNMVCSVSYQVGFGVVAFYSVNQNAASSRFTGFSDIYPRPQYKLHHLCKTPIRNRLRDESEPPFFSTVYQKLHTLLTVQKRNSNSNFFEILRTNSVLFFRTKQFGFSFITPKRVGQI
jgi:hypothetical protein